MKRYGLEVAPMQKIDWLYVGWRWGDIRFMVVNRSNKLRAFKIWGLVWGPFIFGAIRGVTLSEDPAQ